ncbi:MAG: hypothetical protein JRJ45_00345 [Deltaproteobacteria bacterium]|nr:hypothetical protein [Deltaproteobacteria bacterium]
MSWNEFKDFVDEQLNEKGISGDEPLDYIDMSNPDSSHEMSIPTISWDHEGISIY